MRSGAGHATLDRCLIGIADHPRLRSQEPERFLTESDQRRRCFSNALAPGSIGEEIKSVFSMDPIGESEILRHLHEAGVDSHLAPHPNTPEWDLTVGNHVANDALRPQSRASAPTATRDSTIVKRSLITVAALTVCRVTLAQTNDNLVRVQNRLKAEGLFFGDPTGVLDAQTRTALALYQIDHHLTVTGQLDAPTARELDASPQTPMFTPTPRQSPTPTGSPRATATPTPRPPPTATPIATPTSTPTPTPTPSPKPSPTPTATPTPTPTPRPTPSVTPTATPIATPTST